MKLMKYWALILIKISLKLTVVNLVIVSLLVWLLLLLKRRSLYPSTLIRPSVCVLDMFSKFLEIQRL